MSSPPANHVKDDTAVEETTSYPNGDDKGGRMGCHNDQILGSKSLQGPLPLGREVPPRAPFAYVHYHRR